MEIFVIAILILSIVLHELAHGLMANTLGDPTARLQGRLSPNPLKHLDPLGSVIIPGFLVLTGAHFLFGWAKPVPYNPYNIRAPWGLNHAWAEAMVAAAGPLANIILAVVFAGIAHLLTITGTTPMFATFIVQVVFINILLAFFNLIPLPPLDGSKILSIILPNKAAESYRQFLLNFQQIGLMGSLLFIVFFFTFLSDPFFTMISHIVYWLLP